MGLNNMIDMVFDKFSNCLWIYGSRNVFKLMVANEDKEAWKLYMEVN